MQRARLSSPISSTPAPSGLPSSVRSVVGRGGGRPLDSHTRASMEALLAVDLGQVRVHTGSVAESSAESVDALAYTVGHEVVFASGQFAPETPAGRRLLGHELAHVVQQSRGARSATSSAEAEADAAGASLVAGERVQVSGAAPFSMQRQPRTQTPLEAYRSSKEHQHYLQTLRDLQAIDKKVAEAQRELDAIDQRERDAKARLAALQIEGVDLRLRLAAAQEHLKAAQAEVVRTTARAQEAAAKAEESRRTAHRWGRLLGVAELALHSLEAAIACPLAETGIGAIGCIHAVTSMYADSQQTVSGELTPNAFHQAGAGVAKSLGASPRVAGMVGGMVDAAGGLASASAPLLTNPAPFPTRFLPPSDPVAPSEVVPGTGGASTPPGTLGPGSVPPARPVITAHADPGGVVLNEVQYPSVVERARPSVVEPQPVTTPPEPAVDVAADAASARAAKGEVAQAAKTEAGAATGDKYRGIGNDLIKYHDGGSEGLMASLDKDGVLNLYIKAGAKTPRGGAMFNEALEAYGPNVKAVRGTWLGGGDLADNFNSFKAALGRGLTPEQAALETFTGKMASRAGFSKVTVTLNDAKKVVAEFWR